MSSTGSSCVTEVTAAINNDLKDHNLHNHNSESEKDYSSEGHGQDENSDPSPGDSPSPTIRFEGLGNHHDLSNTFVCPIIGHEVMEERARFTVYKLRVESQSTGECWFVFRRYTDFVRLHSKLKSEFSYIDLTLPRKRWFGDNFNPNFIEERTRGLQGFVDSVLQNGTLITSLSTREFFCLDEPPCAIDSVDESRAIFEALEDTLQQLRRQLLEKELTVETLQQALTHQSSENERLLKIMKDCPQCKQKNLEPTEESS